MRLVPIASALLCTLAMAACQPATTEPATNTAATPAPAPASTPAPTAPVVNPVDEARQRLEAVLAGDHRKAEDRARDQYRHPVETLQFFGIKPDSAVLEITPGGGWYLDVLAPYLRAHGRYVGATWDEALPNQPSYAAKLNAALVERLATKPDVYGAASLLPFDTNAPTFGEPNGFDAVLTFRNAHNWISAGSAEAYFKAFFDALKPGGVLGVVDHRAKGEVATDGSTGYVTEQQIIDLATAAGFTLVDRSEINANPNDTTDHPKGVWTLPPSYALGEVDKDKYTAIGESDRMTLKFIKPASPATPPAPPAPPAQ